MNKILRTAVRKTPLALACTLAFVAGQASARQSHSGLEEVIVDDDVNAYASATKGFRIGGINGNLSETLCGAATDCQTGDVGPGVARSVDAICTYRNGSPGLGGGAQYLGFYNPQGAAGAGDRRTMRATV